MLVSVVVITYNSAQFVLETLDSIAAQTYQELELIISDDCSKDNTIEICSNWLEQHRERFVRTELLTVEKNTGIAGNCNRGYAAAHGEWIKGIAGDDLLLPECIKKGMEFAQDKHCNIFWVALQVFWEKNWIQGQSKNWKNFSSDEQLIAILKEENVYPATPGLFCRKEIWERFNGFDEHFPFLEDLPFYIKVIGGGEKIYASDDVLVKYRFYGSSVSHCDKMSESYRNWVKKVKMPLLVRKKYYVLWWHTKIMLWKHQYLQCNFYIRKIISFICFIIDPFYAGYIFRHMTLKK